MRRRSAADPRIRKTDFAHHPPDCLDSEMGSVPFPVEK
jgi:hypothetical protein